MVDEQNWTAVEIDTTIPYQEINELVTEGETHDLGRLAELSLRNHAVWDVVRTSAYGWQEEGRFTRLGVIPFVAVCNGKGMDLSDLAAEAVVDAIKGCTIGKSVVRVMTRQVPYEVLADLGPTQAHQLTVALSCDSKTATLRGHGVEAIGFPELRFVVFGITREGGWPLLPDPPAIDCKSVAEKLGSEIRWIGSPEFIDIGGVTEGVQNWIRILRTEYEVFAWEPFPVGGGTTTLLLEGWSQQDKWGISIDLSVSQLSQDGLAAVLNECASIEQLGIYTTPKH